MRELKILCWNVNGIRAAQRKGLLEWLYREFPDILSLQETKALAEELGRDLREPTGYHTYWNYPQECRGYSGVAVFTKYDPITVKAGGLGVEEFDTEGPLACCH
jgi:exodeoxyribonuclease-3